MIRMIQSSSAGHAKSYFSDALSKSDYYIDSQELQGKIRGRLAERLRIDGSATKDVFFALCDNKNPVTGKQLTPRMKDDRTVFYDVNFHCPKSVSILHALSKDDHILKAFEKSVLETMRDIEKDSKTRVRIKGQNHERNSGELVWGEFTHLTARPLDGSLPDPHLHTHCVIFNATWDETEKKVKACQFRDIKRDMPYYQACFHKRLSDALIDLGYQVRTTSKAFEVKGVPQKVIDLFSKRTDEIGKVAHEKGIKDAKELDQLGARTRSKKQKGHTMTELKAEWKRQIHELEEKDGSMDNKPVRYTKEIMVKDLNSRQCVDYAIKHCFERASVMQDRRILATAIKHSLGHETVSLTELHKRFAEEDRFIHVEEKGKVLTTTREVLSEEKKMVSLALNGQGTFKPLYLKAPEVKLESQQKAAIEHVLTTTNQVSIIAGKAGSGKTSTLKELVPLIEQTGKNVLMVAPSAEASRGVLYQEGFTQAETVAKLLVDRNMQNTLYCQVLIVDEAPMLGTKDMTTLLQLVKEQRARLILMGDTMQHNSVERGDAVRILNTVAGIKTAEISKIYRQRTQEYRKAVEHLSYGDVRTAFELLEDMGAIQNIDPLNPHQELANDYVEAVRQKKSALVVSPTHQQIDEVTATIRQKLKDSKLLGKKEIEAKRYKTMNLTEAQKSDWRNLSEGSVVQFKQNVKNCGRGSIWSIQSSSEKGVFIENDDKERLQLPIHRSKDYEVYEEKIIQLAKGDLIRITKNGFDERKSRLNNGQMLEVQKLSKDGKIILRNKNSKMDYELNTDFGHLAHAYCITSHSSQGKTVDEVFIAQSAETFPATSSKQFYVSVSRGRDRVKIYTDDKAKLIEYASQLGDRQSSLELIQKRNLEKSFIEQRIRESILARDLSQKQQVKPKNKLKLNKDLLYEPEI